MNSFFKKSCSVAALVSSLFATSIYAVDAVNPVTVQDNIKVSDESTSTTQEELATIYVLSEICPNIIGNSKAFEQGYARLAKDYWPLKGDAVKGLKQRAQQQGFEKYLTQARQNANNMTAQNNREVCEDVMAYQ